MFVFQENMFDKMIDMYLDGIYTKLDEDGIDYPLPYVHVFDFCFDQTLLKQQRIGFFGLLDISKDLYKK